MAIRSAWADVGRWHGAAVGWAVGEWARAVDEEHAGSPGEYAPHIAVGGWSGLERHWGGGPRPGVSVCLAVPVSGKGSKEFRNLVVATCYTVAAARLICIFFTLSEMNTRNAIRGSRLLYAEKLICGC
jgi:hypothetical protein